MDFWSRLLNPLSTGTPRKDQAKDPAKRLHRFEKEYGQLLTTWRTSSNLARDSDAAEVLEIRLQELTNVLSDESRRPLPHPCIQYASIKQIYVPIGKIATTSHNEWIIKEAVLLFATLVESEEEAFVENPTFSASLTNLLVRITGASGVRLGLDTESRVVELAFNITTKIRLDPEILPAWFKTQEQQQQQQYSQYSDGGGQKSHGDFAGRTQRGDFPLFYILMDYIHHEGKIGDFARTGLLYIIEAASSSAALEQWIVESDLSTLMATGLGALYSQLSRKLVIDHPPDDLPPILALSDYQHPVSNFEIVSSCSPEFQSHLETFLSHLLFWQDVLNHCKSVEVKSTLLEHFQVIFLQQLLYPSLLESSDIDGGSSVAVLTYLRRVLESLDHPDMINLILHYLLALPDTPLTKRSGSTTSVSDARKRKSMDLATLMAEKPESAATPLLFNLVDLILGCLRSRNQQTIYVTLQLVSAILRRHHRYAVMTLLKTDVLPGKITNRTVGAHEQEIEYLMSLAGSIGGQDNFDAVYENVLGDTMTRVESHPCSLKMVAPRGSVSNTAAGAIDSLPGAPREVREHALRPDDPLLNSLLDVLETFFINPVETNLSVTETVIDLAICGYMSIEGWLARSPKGYAYDEDEEKETAAVEEADIGATSPISDSDMAEPTMMTLENAVLETEESLRAKDMEKCRRRPRWTQQSNPRIFTVLQQLSDQIARYKETVPRFGELLQQRREAFQAAETMLDTPMPVRRGTPGQQGTPERASMDEFSRSGSPSRPSGFEGLAQRLLSELGTPSRSGSPRGRKELSRGSGAASPAGTPGPNPFSTPKGPPVPPKDMPGSFHDSSAMAFPRGRSPHIVPDDEPVVHVTESEASDFAAIDQSILSRKVGLPGDKVDPIPLRFDRKPMPEPVEEEPAAEDEVGSKSAEVGEGEEDAKKRDDIEEDNTGDKEGSEDEAEDHGDGTEEVDGVVSVSHVITNVIVFQSFLLELAALMQVRAGLFSEVRYV